MDVKSMVYLQFPSFDDAKIQRNVSLVEEIKEQCKVIKVKEIVGNARAMDNVVEFQRKPDTQVFMISF